MLALSVNVDHVATLRQARRVRYPDPVAAARLAEAAGASGITVHLRGDRRHIQDADVEALRAAVLGKLNLEMAATDEMCAIAVRTRPDQVSLVPERPHELTTEGGLDLRGQRDSVLRAAERLREAGIQVSVFVDPELAVVDALASFPSGLVSGFEINTDAYTRTATAPAAEVARIAKTARRGREAGFAVFAGHGLSADNVGPIAALCDIEELNIGHALISRAVLIGIDAAVRELLAAMQAGRAG
jgi:pyridoxine 5-phosphate synthase